MDSTQKDQHERNLRIVYLILQSIIDDDEGQCEHDDDLMRAFICLTVQSEMKTITSLTEEINVLLKKKSFLRRSKIGCRCDNNLGCRRCKPLIQLESFCPMATTELHQMQLKGIVKPVLDDKLKMLIFSDDYDYMMKQFLFVKHSLRRQGEDEQFRVYRKWLDVVEDIGRKITKGASLTVNQLFCLKDVYDEINGLFYRIVMETRHFEKCGCDESDINGCEQCDPIKNLKASELINLQLLPKCSVPPSAAASNTDVLRPPRLSYRDVLLRSSHPRSAGASKMAFN